MNLLGFYLGWHDSNVAAAVDGRVYYAKSERLAGKKHHRATMEFVSAMCEQWGIKHIDAIAFSDGDRNHLGKCDIDQLVRQTSPLVASVPTFCLDHYYAHILSAWPVTALDSVAIGIAIDGRGDNEVRVRVISDPGTTRAQSLFYSQRESFGGLFTTIGDLLNLRGDRLDFGGKIMGLQALGEIDHQYVEALDIPWISNNLLDLILRVPWRGNIPARTNGFFDPSNQSFRDWLATVHYAVQQVNNTFFGSWCQSDQHIVFSGGCAQNTVYNQTLMCDFPGLTIPPHCYDGGLSLGCLELLRMHFDQPKFSTERFPFWQFDEGSDEPGRDVTRRAAELLSAGKIIGWFQGHGEIGPRALGHRSILMDPRIADGKDLINSGIKHREHWRPYAPSVLLSHVDEWFDLPVPSPYMLRAVPVRAERRDLIPAVVHCDGTSRVQTVADGDVGLSPFHELLTEFYKRTGVPMLLNTSLNSGGGPIFGRAGQARDFFASVPLDALVIGNNLFEKG